MVEIKNLNDAYVRSALWNAYNKKCFYCKELLHFRNMDLDHIIPKSLGRERAIELYTLDSDFELNSYYNIVPTCRTCNNRKGAINYDKITILHYLNIIRMKIPKIENLENEFRTKNLQGELTATLGKVLSESPISDVLNILNDFNLTSLAHNVLTEALQKISPVPTLSPSQNQQIQKFVDGINQILQDFIPINYFYTIKGNKFIDNKAAIVIVDEWAGAVTYSLYAVPKTAKNLIKAISKDHWFKLAHQGLFNVRTTDAKSTLLDFPIREAKLKMITYFSNLISINATYKSINFYICNEFMINLLDRLSIPFGQEIKDEYKIEEIEFSLYTYLPLW